MSTSDPGGDDAGRRAAPPGFPWLRTTPLNLASSDVVAGPAPSRRSRPGRWIAVAALALVSCAGGILVGRAGGDRSPAPAAPRPAVAVPVTAPETPAAEEVVVYLVTSTGKGDKARVEYTDEDRDIIRKGEVSLPWRHTFRTSGDRPPLVLLAQRRKGGTGPVTCSISVDGKTLTTAVQEGRSAAPQCSA